MSKHEIDFWTLDEFQWMTGTQRQANAFDGRSQQRHTLKESQTGSLTSSGRR